MQKDSPHVHRILHCSDIHFRDYPKSPFQCLNKRIKGVLRQLLGFANFQAKPLALRFPHIVSQLQLDSICITGDFSLTALDSEFSAAQTFVHQLQNLVPVFTIPGNHDVYTAQAFREQIYYEYFPNEQLQRARIACYPLSPHWWLLLLDCSYLNGWCTAHGQVSQKQLTLLQQMLQTLPAKANIIVANHYPLLSTQHPSHDLLNNAALYHELKKFPNVRLYLHGHDHKAAISSEGSLTIINSGSFSLPSNACCHVIDLSPENAKIFRLQLTNLDQISAPLKYTITERIVL